VGTLLELREITIDFPGVKALDRVHFKTETGRAHALIGANGAGKSTLMKVLSGAYNHYQGEIWINGNKISIRSPRDAQDNGIQTVYQEVDTALIPNLTVGENLMLNETVRSMKKKLVINWKELHCKATKLLERIHLNVTSNQLVSELTLAEKQMILIGRAISTQCRFLILDEPTAPLSITETKELFRVIRELKENGVGIIFISHRLPEIFELCDDITVLRNGQFIIQKSTTLINQNELIEKMLGEKLEEQFVTFTPNIGETVLQLNKLYDYSKIKEITMHVKRGEIIGVAGLVGAGKTELCKTIFGASKVLTGDLILKGKKRTFNSPHDAVKNRIAFIPEERRKEGVLINESVAANLTSASINYFTRLGTFMNRKAEKKISLGMIERLGIKTPTSNTLVEKLSGGNQQKIAIGKWLIADAEVYIFDEPTKGVDVGAKKEIFSLITDLAKRGKAVIYASSEFSEIIGISNRVYVLYDGKSVKEFETSQTNEQELLYYSTGGQ
jgi:simple sugar transport system ATP-binding protein